MKPRTVDEAIKHFARIVEEREIIPKQNEVVKLISGSIFNARQNLRTLNSKEAASLLSEIGCSPNFGDDVRTNILGIFEQEVLRAQRLLKEVDSSIGNLQESIDDITYRLRTESNSNSKEDGCKRVFHLLLDCYDHCQSIMTFLKLKNKILKHYLLTPADVFLTSDPFSHFSDYKEEEENISYLMCKIEYANLSN